MDLNTNSMQIGINMKKMSTKRIGIDIGGTFIKGGIVDEYGKVLYFTKHPTPTSKSPVDTCDTIVKMIGKLCERQKVFSQNLGIACAGAIDKSKGVVLKSANLKWTEVPLKKMVEEKIGMSVSVINDADAALLTEMKFGAGKEYTDAVLLTLGTGIGSSIFNKGKLIEPIELGHMVIKINGKKCACGRKGCFETYCSANALKNDVIKATKKFETKMKNDLIITAETAFKYYDSDKVAKKVADRYFELLICGIANIAHIFQPQVIILGGGLSLSMISFLKTIEKRINDLIPFPIILTAAQTGNEAGLIGATLSEEKI